MRFPLSLAFALTLAGCVGPASPPPPAPRPVQPAPAPATPPPAAAAAAPASDDWTLRPATPGEWRYRTEAGGSAALFGAPAGGTLLTIRCDRPGRRIHLIRAGAGRGPMILRTSYGAVSWPAAPGAGPSPETVAIRSASDAALDQLAYSRGRFAVELAGLPPLVLPAWAEPARVIEDCRG
ncbi:hypothetical protein WG908_12235 [Sphingobium sp. AN641]|uniref:hypothetical protein n=1 Tax=Sphingobium sp. AN641 TaxID=3133443 RepID=UPI0030BCA2F2